MLGVAEEYLNLGCPVGEVRFVRLIFNISNASQIAISAFVWVATERSPPLCDSYLADSCLDSPTFVIATVAIAV